MSAETRLVLLVIALVVLSEMINYIYRPRR